MTDKMTPEQALKYFKHRVSTKGQCGDNTTQRYAFDMAIEALEKQIPKKPEYTKTNTPYCPVCGDLLAEDFCGDCGQAIDWESDTE